MPCDEFLDRLNDSLDDPSDQVAREAVRRHAVACAECRALLERWRQVDAVLRSGAYDRPEPQTATTRPAIRRAVATRRGPGAPLVAAAAALLIAVAVGRSTMDGPPAAHPEPALAPAALATADAAPSPGAGVLHQIDAARVRAWARQAWEPVDPLAEGVRPIAGSFRTALDAFSDALPLSAPHPVG